MPRSPITTHVLDTALGRPAAGIKVKLEAQLNGAYKEMASGETDADGRIMNLLPEGNIPSGVYRMTFYTEKYHFDTNDGSSFYPYVVIVFEVNDGSQHYHVPLLLSPYGYSTYRGS